MNKGKTIFYITVISALLILVIVSIISVVVSKADDRFEIRLDRSIYNIKPSGYAAWQKVAANSNIDLKLWKGSFRSLQNSKESNATMLIVSPEFATGTKLVFTPSDIDNLLNWVRKGNTLLFVDDFNRRSSKNFLSKLSIRLEPLLEDEDKADEKEDDSENTVFGENYSLKDHKMLYSKEKKLFDVSGIPILDFKADTISSTSKVRLKDKYIDPLISDENGLVLGKRRYGKGKIYILTLPDLVDNSYLYEDEDNYQFFTNLLLAEGNNIFINEYVHGFMNRDNAMSYYKNTLLSPIFNQILFFMVILIWSVSRRFGRIRPIVEPERTTNIEYVEAIGNLYKKAGLTGTALAPVYNQFRQHLCKHLNIDIKVNNDDLFAAINKSFSNVQSKELISLILNVQAVMKDNTISKDVMLNYCQKLNEYRNKGIKYAERS